MNYFIQFLTIFRIIIAPLIFIMIAFFQFYGFSLILFLMASVSDYWDGFLARKYNLQSDFGEILDPVADKILITFLVISLSIELSSIFIGLIGGIIIMREFWVGALREVNARRGNSSITGVYFLAKVKTTIQFITFSSYLLGLYLGNSLLIFASDFLLFLAFVITLQTGIQYTRDTYK
tara:strand:- start:163 stop:696 length:534 start_codon:yes stop_codon:yes gene_type:complete